MKMRLTAATLVLLALVPALTTQAAVTDYPVAYQEAVSESAAQNHSFPTSDGDGSATCVISPFDAYSGDFRGSGAGSPQRRVDGEIVKAEDHALFSASCSGIQSAGFTLAVDYEFEWRDSSGDWLPIPNTQAHCEAVSEKAGSAAAATVNVPGTPGCDPSASYPIDDPVVGTFHRLHSKLTTSSGQVVEGVSVPWVSGDALLQEAGVPECPLSTFSISPSAQALDQGAEATFTVAAAGDCADSATDVTVVVEGANPGVHLVPMEEGTGTFSYLGASEGTDQVVAVRYGGSTFPVEASVSWSACPFESVQVDPATQTLEQGDDVELVVRTTSQCGSFGGVGVVATLEGVNSGIAPATVGTTDGEGEFQIAYTGVLVGVDEISVTARSVPGATNPPTPVVRTASATVQWTTCVENCSPEDTVESVVQPPSPDAWVQDAEGLADDLGVTLPEALGYLLNQELVGELDEALSVGVPTFAGMELDYNPYRIVAYLTAPSEQYDEIQEDPRFSPLAPVLVAQPADYTLEQLEAAADNIHETVNVVPYDVEVDVTSNRVSLIPDSADQLDDLQSAIDQGGHLLPPDAYSAGPDVGMIEAGAAIRAGDRLDSSANGSAICTAGFTVEKKDSSTTGISTAGHCDGPLYHDGTYLPFVTEITRGSRDVQWQKTPGLRDVPQARDASDNRRRKITGTRARKNQTKDMWMCHWGEYSAYSCGYIKSKVAMPDTNEVEDANATFIKVRHRQRTVCKPGDSGGPWYNGTVAVGIHHGHIDPDGDNVAHICVYMAINYIGKLGVKVRTA